MSRISAHKDRPHNPTERKPPRTQRSAVPVDWKGLDAVPLWEAGVRRVNERRDGVHISPSGRLIGVPYRAPDGRVARWKLFRPGVKGSRWERARQGLVLPFGLELSLSGFAALAADALLCEGESDALSARSVFAERDGRSVRVFAIPGANLWRASWAHYFADFGRTYILGDGDAAGRAMADRILADLPARYVRIPEGDDVRSMIQSGRGGDLAALLDKADEVAAIDAAMRRVAFEGSRARAHIASARRSGYRTPDMRYAA